jgi:cell division protein FtsW (lipid II flippase)
VLLGLTVGASLLVVPINVWKRLAPWLLVASFALLAVVAIPGIGHSVNGSRRWLQLGPLNFQPSELARWLLVTYIAIFAVRHQTELRSSAEGFFKPLAVLVAAAGLLLAEPDFGAAVVLCVTGTRCCSSRAPACATSSWSAAWGSWGSACWRSSAPTACSASSRSWTPGPIRSTAVSS